MVPQPKKEEESEVASLSLAMTDEEVSSLESGEPPASVPETSSACDVVSSPDESSAVVSVPEASSVETSVVSPVVGFTIE